MIDILIFVGGMVCGSLIMLLALGLCEAAKRADEEMDRQIGREQRHDHHLR